MRPSMRAAVAAGARDRLRLAVLLLRLASGGHLVVRAVLAVLAAAGEGKALDFAGTF